MLSIRTICQFLKLCCSAFFTVFFASHTICGMWRKFSCVCVWGGGANTPLDVFSAAEA